VISFIINIMGSSYNVGTVITVNDNGTGEILGLIGKSSGRIITFMALDTTNIKVDSVVSFVTEEGVVVTIVPTTIEQEEPKQDG